MGARANSRISPRAIPPIHFAGRVRDGLVPKFALQLEATAEPSIWIALDPPELDRWAGVIERMWKRWGTRPGRDHRVFRIRFQSARAARIERLRRLPAPRRCGTSGPDLGLQRRGRGDGWPDGGDRRDSQTFNADQFAAISRFHLRWLWKPCGVNLADRVRWVAISEVEGAISRAEADQIIRAARRSGLAHPAFRCGFFSCRRMPGLSRVSCGQRVSRGGTPVRPRRGHDALRKRMPRDSLRYRKRQARCAAAARWNLVRSG